MEALGECSEARDCFHQAISMARQGGFRPLVLEALVGLISLLIKAGEQERALLLLGFALAQPTLRRETRHRLDRFVLPRLNGLAYQDTQAWASGQTLSLEEALALACGGSRA